ncbi:hypothetical protein BIW11_03646 [Tropilaelaps mercedesae]|uniref:Uncharacterized protein n=1 Tax=Tropilaelaps mercedesae TaxID=418985 RepID=A0A1V9XHY2_9ACAR|nr:hypothetical protein BIW11_03646 [Tropilaelaps mercedesae]
MRVVLGIIAVICLCSGERIIPQKLPNITRLCTKGAPTRNHPLLSWDETPDYIVNAAEIPAGMIFRGSTRFDRHKVLFYARHSNGHSNDARPARLHVRLHSMSLMDV